MLDLSPAAQAFWGDIIRRLLTLVAGALVTHGLVSQSDASAYTQELVGVILGLGVTAWGNRTVYWGQIRAIVGRSLPSAASHAMVTAKVDDLAAASALPSVFTPETVIPALVKPTLGGMK